MSGASPSWVCARDALQCVSIVLKDEWAAMAALRKHARSTEEAGSIRTRGIVKGQVEQLDPMFWTGWAGADGRPGTGVHEGWDNGRFEGVGPLGPGLCASKVEFSADDLRRLYPDAGVKSKQAKTGRPPANWWPILAVELTVLIHEEGEDHRAEHLTKKLLDRMAAQGVDQLPSRTSALAVVTDLLARLASR